MKPTIIIILLLTFSLQLNARETIRIGYVEYPPATNTDAHGNATGVVIDIINEKLKKRFDIEWHHLPAVRLQWALDNNIIDVDPFIVYSEDTRNKYHLLPKPFITLQPHMCHPNNPTDDIDSIISQLPRSTVIVAMNSNYQTYAPYLNKNQATLLPITYQDYVSRSILLLQRGSAEYVLLPTIYGLEDKLKKAKIYCTPARNKIHLYLALKKDSPYITAIEEIFNNHKTIEY